MIDQNVCRFKLVMWLIVLSIGVVASDRFGNQFEPNYETNKINKGIWLRHKHQDDAPETTGRFFFRAVSNEEEAFSPNTNDVPFLARDKRATPSTSRKRHIKSVKVQAKEPDSKSSVFNDFPLGVAMLLENSNNKNVDYSGYPRYETKAPFNETNEADKLKQATNKENPEKNNIIENDTLNYIKDMLNMTEGNITAKRSMKYDELVVDRIDFLDVFNKSKDFNEVQNNQDQMWQTAPVDTNLYEITPIEPKTDLENRTPINERGLIKVLSMLTRTFRKIMKQHNAIKMVHNQINNISERFGDKIEVSTKKLNDFDLKYATIMKTMDKLKSFQEYLKSKEEVYKNKEELMSKKLLDFDNQQKKFLAQQKQFYNIQKAMLAQNEKINSKQNSIAKMQNEISHRQNHFAKVLKKAKQALQNNKNDKLNTGMLQTKIYTEKANETNHKSTVTTVKTTTGEPVTINLFSIAPNNVIENQDKLILKEKDDKSVDDLIYKYYFNNTFLDTVIRNKILGGVLVGDKTTIARNAKLTAKRNEDKTSKTQPESTIMLPVNDTIPILKRERRWINHHSTKKHKKRIHSKGHPNPTDTLSKPNINKDINQSPSTAIPEPPKIMKESDMIAKDPFLGMATNFCKQIGQSTSKQILDWCVEKTIRRLRNLDRIMVPGMIVPPSPPSPKQLIQPPVFTKSTDATVSGPVTVTAAPPMFVTQRPAAKSTGYFDDRFFPDNDELESNLKQFDLTPDTAGNVYYDGSLHTSQIIDDDGVSDILPGFDSNSKIDIDTRLIQLQLRKKYLRDKLPQNLRQNQ